MKAKALLFCLFMLRFTRPVFGQFLESGTALHFDSYKNSVYAELGGNGIIGSLNYERLFPVSDGFTFAARVGGFYLPDGKANYGYTLPAELSLLCGSGNRKFEAGFGYTYFRYVDEEPAQFEWESNSTTKTIPVLRLGARRQFRDSPFFVRSAVTFLFIESVTLGKFPIPWLGFSAGYSFGRK